MFPVLVNFLSLTTMENVLISINYSQKLISARESIHMVIQASNSCICRYFGPGTVTELVVAELVTELVLVLVPHLSSNFICGFEFFAIISVLEIIQHF